MAQALVPVGQVAPGGQIFLDPSTTNTMVPPPNTALSLGGATTGLTQVRLPNGTVIQVNTADVPNLVAAYQQMTQQQQVVDLAGGGRQAGAVPNTVVGNFAKGAQAVSGTFTSLNVGRLIDRAATFAADADKAKADYQAALKRIPNEPLAVYEALNALTAYMDADSARGDAQDDIVAALNTQGWVNAAGEGAQLYERLAQQGGMGGGSGMGGVALAFGGGLLLSEVIANRRPRY